jgi:hypothetical protein
MAKLFATLLGACVFLCAAVVALPILLVLAVAALILFGVFAGSGFIALVMLALVVIVPVAILLHLFVPLLVPLLVICAIVYLLQDRHGAKA